MSEQISSNSTIDLTTLKNEVDALQIAVHGQRTPWYKSISILISMIALAFSFGTTAVSYVRTQQQDVQAARVELRELLQRLAELPQKNVEIAKKYERTDPAAHAYISGLINQENALLSRQAAEITRRIPKEYLSATEYYSIALALQNSYNVEAAKEFLDRAVEASVDFNDRIAALRTKASLLFLTGAPGAGRFDYQRALGIFAEFKGQYNDYTRRYTHITTHLAWAFSEAGESAFDEALRHIDEAEKHLAGISPSPGRSMLQGQIEQARSVISGGVVPVAAPQQPSVGLR